MVSLKVAAALLGALGLLLAGALGHAPSHGATAPPQPLPAAPAVQFGGVSGQAATAAGTQDLGAAWYTQGPDGLTGRLTAGR